ncbi:MAG: amino-acid N-acetyltransferase [Neisseria sp.]|nr:amino-acid N-acetyltransferase [Neisseria sp.]
MTTAFVRDFREAAPYIDHLRGKILVIALSDGLLLPDKFRPIAADIGLLASLGVKTVLVYGCGRQAEVLARQVGIKASPAAVQGCRVIGATLLNCAKQADGILRAGMEAALSAATAHPLQRGRRRLRTASGNFLSARPAGIIEGVDTGAAGHVRKADTEAVRAALNTGAVVLAGPLASSLSGKTFWLETEEAAEALATALAAEKLIFLTDGDLGGLPANLSSAEAKALLDEGLLPERLRAAVRAAVNAVGRNVARCQILSGPADGSLIGELFTREGNGASTSIAQNPFTHIRAADIGDIAEIAGLISPLAESGVLLRRSRAYLENHIGEFFVLEYDCRICGCIALRTFADDPSSGELACLAVAPEVRDGGCGEHLLDYLFDQARARGLKRLFALSTQTGEWFAERGFHAAPLSELPASRRAEYEASGRHSQIFVRHTDPGGGA